MTGDAQTKSIAIIFQRPMRVRRASAWITSPGLGKS
jgi:hypothetical protein